MRLVTAPSEGSARAYLGYRFNGGKFPQLSLTTVLPMLHHAEFPI
jgi:hypothetical protein